MLSLIIILLILSGVLFIIYVAHVDKLNLLRDLPKTIIMSKIVRHEEIVCKWLLRGSCVAFVLSILMLFLL